MKKITITLVVLFLAFLQSCDMYPDWKNYVSYSDAYPICGEYLVRDFGFNADVTTDAPVNDWYHIYLYNKSYNPTKDSIWIDNKSGHPTGGATYNFKYKIKCKADTVNLSFNIANAGDIVGSKVNPLDTCVKVTIENSKIWDFSDDITDPTPDSIYFEFSYYNKQGVLTAHYKTVGHRKTGWEEPNYSDDM